MKLLILEPHGDDAFISCSSAMMQDFDITVQTMSDRDSHALSDVYKSVKDTLWMDAPDIHYDLRLKYSTHDIHKRFLAGEDLYLKYLADMTENIMRDNISHFDAFIKRIEANIDLIPVDYDLAIVPLGLFHPNHYATWRVSMSIIPKPIPVIYYVDKPYIEKRYVQEILKCSNYDLYTAPVQDKETRRDLFKRLYPTEQGLLRFSSQTILEWKDIYAVAPSYADNAIVREFLNKVSDMQKGDKYENLVCHVPQD